MSSRDSLRVRAACADVGDAKVGAPFRGVHLGALLLTASALLVVTGCDKPDASAPTRASHRLVDLFTADAIANRAPNAAAQKPLAEWRFDHPVPPSEPSDESAPAHGWNANASVAELTIRDGRLTGKSTGDVPLLHVERTESLPTPDTIHAVEIRMRASAGANLALRLSGGESVDLEEMTETIKGTPWAIRSPIVADDQFHTYTLKPRAGMSSKRLRHLVLQPCDVADAVFEIESVRVVFRAEHLATIPSGIGWHGLANIYHEAIAARPTEQIRLSTKLPPRPWLDVSLGTITPGPMKFRAGIQSGGANETMVLERTVTMPDRWEPVRVDLSEFAGADVSLTLSFVSQNKSAIGFWGSPVVRSGLESPKALPGDPPQGVILIWADTLRRDHLSVYGYERETSPVLERMAQEGALFDDCIVQATWTKVSTPSLMTGMYPGSHGVREFDGRLPASVTTMAEVFRDAGYATMSLSSILFTGKFTNLHQGFEQVHESSSLPDLESSKTSREYVNRLLPWLETHRDVPFFVFLHVADPHDPFEPYPPYDSMWADPADKDKHDQHAQDVRAFIEDPLLKDFGMPNRKELVAAGIDPDEYIDHEMAWYDGSIRGMDAEIGRLLERLKQLGLDRKTLVLFTSDHGEEFLDHGRMFHGQSVYGELNHMPLIMWRPGGIAPGLRIAETVENIDLMPTILGMCGLTAPQTVQGQSMLPLLADGAARDEWVARSTFSEKASTVHGSGPPPRDTESYAVVQDGWKLIHNKQRPQHRMEYELYRHDTDSLDQDNVADANPAIVKKLAQRLEAWHAYTASARLKPDQETQGELSSDELTRLRSLGYID